MKKRIEYMGKRIEKNRYPAGITIDVKIGPKTNGRCPGTMAQRNPKATTK